MKVEMSGDNYQVTLTRDELLTLINGLGEKQIMIREIGSIINPAGKKKSDKQLDKIQKALASALDQEAWKDSPMEKANHKPNHNHNK